MRFHRPRNAHVWHVVKADDSGTLCGRSLDPNGTSHQPGDDDKPGYALGKICRACWFETMHGKPKEATR